MRNFKRFIIGFVFLTLLFQVFHFSEHLIQLGAWLSGFRNMPFMTPWATDLTWALGEWIVPGEEDYHRIFAVGVDFLHLLGNGVFLLGTLGLHFLVKNKYSKWANIFQGVHVFEHIMLFSSQYFIHQAIGMSTLFGYFQPYGTDVFNFVSLTSFRVWWHFIANLIPTLLVVFALYNFFRNKKTAK